MTPFGELSAAFLKGDPEDYHRATCLRPLSTTENPGQAYNKSQFSSAQRAKFSTTRLETATKEKDIQIEIAQVKHQKYCRSKCPSRAFHLSLERSPTSSTQAVPAAVLHVHPDSQETTEEQTAQFKLILPRFDLLQCQLETISEEKQ